MEEIKTARIRYVEVAKDIYAAIAPAQGLDITDAGLIHDMFYRFFCYSSKQNASKTDAIYESVTGCYLCAISGVEP